MLKEDEAIKEECRAELVKLQQGDAENTAIWIRCLELSKKGLNVIYDRLDVSFDYWMGESAYKLLDEMIAGGPKKKAFDPSINAS